MRLATKLILLFLVGILLVVSIFAYTTIQAERDLAVLEHQQRAKAIAEALKNDPAVRVTGEQFLNPSTNPSLAPLQIESRIRIIELGANRELTLTQKEITTITRPDESGQSRFYSYLPFPSDENNKEVKQGIEISDPDREATQRIRRSLISSLLAFFGATSLSGLIIWIGGLRMVGRPLTALTEKVNRIGQGDFSRPLHLKSKDELGDLSCAINEMCDQLEIQRIAIREETKFKVDALEQLRHSDRLTTVGQMAAGFAHEIGTPLNVILGRAELIANGTINDTEARKSAATIREESKRISKIVRSLLDFSRPQKPQRNHVSINQLLSRTIETMLPLASNQNVTLNLEMPEDQQMAFIDYGQIEQVFTNLLMNAIQSISEQGVVDIRLGFSKQRVEPDSNAEPIDCYVISFQDNGIGVPLDAIHQVFDPFFTTKSVGEGTGLGLSIAHGIIKEHHGWIELKTQPGQGSLFSVCIPSDSTAKTE